jgi:MFS family permease
MDVSTDEASIRSPLMREVCNGASFEDEPQESQSVRGVKDDMRTIIGLCSLGFFVSCQPSEPYLTQYLRTDKGLSETQLDNTVWPYDTYGFFVFLLPAGILAELVGYRGVILTGLICREATRVVLLFAQGVTWMAAMQLTYAFASATNQVYFAFVYMIVEPDTYQSSTSYVRASYCIGDFIGSITGQLLVKYTTVHEHLQVLFYISWTCTSLGLLSFVYFVPHPTKKAPAALSQIMLTKGARGVADELSVLYSMPRMKILLLWWVVAFSSNNIFGNYFQNLLLDLDPNADFGVVEALMGLFGAFGAMLLTLSAGRCGRGMSSFCASILVLTSIVNTVLYGMCAQLSGSGAVVVAEICTVAIAMVFSFQYALVSTVIATELAEGPLESQR